MIKVIRWKTECGFYFIFLYSVLYMEGNGDVTTWNGLHKTVQCTVLFDGVTRLSLHPNSAFYIFDVNSYPPLGIKLFCNLLPTTVSSKTLPSTNIIPPALCFTFQPLILYSSSRKSLLWDTSYDDLIRNITQPSVQISFH